MVQNLIFFMKIDGKALEKSFCHNVWMSTEKHIYIYNII